ncbi:MAG TPA: hypothetical protein VL200_12870 [Lacunisphaera sp.]|jgi:hypothetical protein|nr:hypothetical protein [Lacunisphaera sp.]
MIPLRFTPSVLAAFGLAAFVVAVGAGTPTPDNPAAPPAETQPAATVALPEPATEPWSVLARYTYDQRDQFLAGLPPLLAKVDEQVGELMAKRAAMNKGAVDMREWDFAMKEMGHARSYLAGMAKQMTKAPREHWDEQKDRLGRAWVRTQEAYGKVRASTTY